MIDHVDGCTVIYKVSDAEFSEGGGLLFGQSSKRNVRGKNTKREISGPLLAWSKEYYEGVRSDYEPQVLK